MVVDIPTCLDEASTKTQNEVQNLEAKPLPSVGGFSITKDKLKDLVKSKQLMNLGHFGGSTGLFKSLQTNLENGIFSEKDIERRKSEFGSNTYKQSPQKAFSKFLVEAFKEPYKILTLGSSAGSLVFRFIQGHSKEGWEDVISILVSILLNTLSAHVKFKQEKCHLKRLMKISSIMKIVVVREGRRRKISILDVVVGDVVILNIGDQIPAGGLFIDGDSLFVDVSMGKCDPVEIDPIKNPFLISGAKVVKGTARMLVLSVGMDTDTDWYVSDEQTQIQSWLNKMNTLIGKIASGFASLDLIAVLIRHFTRNETDSVDMAFITNGVVAILEGISLAFTVSLTYSTNGMMDHQAMVKKSSVSETIGSATAICIHTSRVAIKPGVKEAIKSCRSAGVHVIMITEETHSTAKATAIACGIVKVDPDGSTNGLIEGEVFRNYTDKERMEKVDRIRVMASSSESDKLLMVKCLKKKGHVVAFTGQNKDDVQALKEANIGIYMGTKGSELAKQSSDIVILDDDFSSVLEAVKWGRHTLNNIQKFAQFLTPANLAAFLIDFIIINASGQDFPLTVLHMLWESLIIVVCALPLATEKPSIELLMKKPPVVARDSLGITNITWIYILAQSIIQIVILLVLWFKVGSFLNVNEKVKNTITFNTFVFCQLFNLFNSRKPEKMNVFEGLHENKAFLGVFGLTIGIQIVWVEFGMMHVADTERLNTKQWAICIAFAALSFLIGWFVKLITVVVKSFRSYIRSSVDLRQVWINTREHVLLRIGRMLPFVMP